MSESRMSWVCSVLARLPLLVRRAVRDHKKRLAVLISGRTSGGGGGGGRGAHGSEAAGEERVH